MGYQGVLARLFVSVSCKKYSKQLDWIKNKTFEKLQHSSSLFHRWKSMRACRHRQAETEAETSLAVQLIIAGAGLNTRLIVLNNQQKYDVCLSVCIQISF